MEGQYIIARVTNPQINEKIERFYCLE
jgi:hypothetical protein